MFEGPFELDPTLSEAPYDTGPGDPAPAGKLEIIGHRGYAAVAPENTLASLEAALAAGVRAVEFDLHVASCGTPVLFHDVNLGRTTNGVGPVRRRTLGQLKALDAGKWFSAAFAGEKVPSLTEALDALNGRVDRIYPEVKGFRELEDLDRMVRLVREADLVDRTTFIGMDWNILDRIRGQEPGLGIGFIVETADQFDEALERAKKDSKAILDLSHSLALEDLSMVERTREAGIDVAVWTVNDPDEATRLGEVGVTRFTTDHVERLLEWGRLLIRDA